MLEPVIETGIALIRFKHQCFLPFHPMGIARQKASLSLSLSTVSHTKYNDFVSVSKSLYGD